MSYERDKVIGLASRIFNAEGFTWYDKGKPSYEDIEKVICKLEEDAYNASDDFGGTAETGRIKVEYDKEAEMYCYYLNLGSVY